MNTNTNTAVETVIKKYGLYLAEKDGQEAVGVKPAYAKWFVQDNAKPLVVAHKAEIIACLKARAAAEKAAAEERAAKIVAIPGLAEIKAAIADDDEWRHEYEAAMETENGAIHLRPRPNVDIDALRAQYPQASAYIRAEALSSSCCYEYAAIGREALEMVINGDHQGAREYIDARKKQVTGRARQI